MIRSKVTIFAVAAIAFVFAASSVAVAGPKGDNLVTVAQAVNASGPYAGSFDTLIAALTSPAAAGILAKVNGNGQFTVFAPTDDAFDMLNLNPGNVGSFPGLEDVLLYHVARGRRGSGDVTSSSQIRTLGGGFISVSGTVLNGNTNIIVADVEASNGIIHAIDKVLIP